MSGFKTNNTMGKELLTGCGTREKIGSEAITWTWSRMGGLDWATRKQLET